MRELHAGSGLVLGARQGRWHCRAAGMEDTGVHTLTNLLDSQVTGIVLVAAGGSRECWDREVTE